MPLAVVVFERRLDHDAAGAQVVLEQHVSVLELDAEEVAAVAHQHHQPVLGERLEVQADVGADAARADAVLLVQDHVAVTVETEAVCLGRREGISVSDGEGNQ